MGAFDFEIMLCEQEAKIERLEQRLAEAERLLEEERGKNYDALASKDLLSEWVEEAEHPDHVNCDWSEQVVLRKTKAHLKLLAQGGEKEGGDG